MSQLWAGMAVYAGSSPTTADAWGSRPIEGAPGLEAKPFHDVSMCNRAQQQPPLQPQPRLQPQPHPQQQQQQQQEQQQQLLQQQQQPQTPQSQMSQVQFEQRQRLQFQIQRRLQQQQQQLQMQRATDQDAAAIGVGPLLSHLPQLCQMSRPVLASGMGARAAAAADALASELGQAAVRPVAKPSVFTSTMPDHRMPKFQSAPVRGSPNTKFQDAYCQEDDEAEEEAVAVGLGLEFPPMRLLSASAFMSAPVRGGPRPAYVQSSESRKLATMHEVPAEEAAMLSAEIDNPILSQDWSDEARKVPCVGNRPAAARTTDSSVDVPTLGSAMHKSGTCKPCLFWYQGLCHKARRCLFCHIPHDPDEVAKVRPSKKTRGLLQQSP